MGRGRFKDADAFLKYLSGLNLAGWYLADNASLYVVVHPGPYSSSEVPGGRPAVPPARLWHVADWGDSFSTSAASVIKKGRQSFLKDIIGVGATDIVFDDPEVVRHTDRLREQAKAARQESRTTRAVRLEANFRQEFRNLVSRSNKYKMSKDEALEAVRDEVRLLEVKDVMTS